MIQELLSDFERQNVNNDFSGLSTPISILPPEFNGRVSVSCQNSKTKKYSLSFEQAQEYAQDFISKLPVGTTFTCFKVFQGIETRFDRRRLGTIIRTLQGNDIIDRIEYVKEQRENGNASIVALFQKIK